MSIRYVCDECQKVSRNGTIPMLDEEPKWLEAYDNGLHLHYCSSACADAAWERITGNNDR